MSDKQNSAQQTIERVFNLPEKLTVGECSALHQQLSQLMQKRPLSSLTLDAEKVVTFDTAGIQLLLMVEQYCRRQFDITVQFKHVSDELLAGIDNLGLTETFSASILHPADA